MLPSLLLDLEVVGEAKFGWSCSGGEAMKIDVSPMITTIKGFLEVVTVKKNKEQSSGPRVGSCK